MEKGMREEILRRLDTCSNIRGIDANSSLLQPVQIECWLEDLRQSGRSWLRRGVLVK